jgi:PBP1b-binding outer membrane lipoprotein LpoB
MKKEIAMLIALALLAVSLAGCLGNTSPSPTPTKPAQNTTIVLNSTTIAQGSPIAITASLKSDGQLLDNKTIYWYLNNQSLRNVTTVNGTATLRLTASETSQFSVGTNLLKAEFKGDDSYERSNASVTLTVTPAAQIGGNVVPTAVIPTAVVPTYTPANTIPTVVPVVTKKPVITVS